MSLITDPLPTRCDGWLILNEGRAVNATNAAGWLLVPTLWIDDVSYGLGTVADLIASWVLTAEQVATAIAGSPSGAIKYRLTVGMGDALRSVVAGFLMVSEQNVGSKAGSSVELSAGVAQSAIAQAAMVAAQAAQAAAVPAAAAAVASAAAAEAARVAALAETTAALAAQNASLSSTYVAGLGSGCARFLTRARRGDTLKIVALGDSILAGATVTAGTNDALTLIRAALATRYPSATFTATNRAVSGNTVASSFIDGRFAPAITGNADLYVIGFAKNDVVADGYTVPVSGYPLAQSLRGLEIMVREIRRLVPKADIIIMGENPNAAADVAGNAAALAWAQQAKQVAAIYGCEWVDTYAPFIALGDYSTLMADNVHPNVSGHQVIANTLLASLPAAFVSANPASGATPAAIGLARVQDVDTTPGNGGWVSLLLPNTAIDRASWANIGSGWSAWDGAKYSNSVAGEFFECTFNGTEFAARLGADVTANAVVDVTIDGSIVHANLPLTTYPTTAMPWIVLAKGLSTTSHHTVRVTVKSGTLNLYGAPFYLAAAIPATPPISPRQSISGRWYGAPDPFLQGAAALTAGWAYLVPIFTPWTAGYNKIGINVNVAAASSTIRLGIYSADAADRPGRVLLDAGTVDSSTTGFKTITISKLLQPGWHWLCAVALGGAPTVQASTLAHPLVVTSADPSGVAVQNCYYQTGQTGLPSSWASAPNVGGAGPRVYLAKS